MNSKDSVQLRLYLYEEGGLWLYKPENNTHYRPLILTVSLVEDKADELQPTLMRAAERADRQAFKKFDVSRLPYDLVAGLMKQMKDFEPETEFRFLNLDEENFDPQYRALVLFATAKGSDKSKAYGPFRWFSASDIAAPSEQDEDGLLGLDTLHLQKLKQLVKASRDE